MLRIALPKGRLWDSTKELFEKSGIRIDCQDRNYQPTCSSHNLKLYIVKPRNIPLMVSQGLVDAGVVGTDLVIDEEADVNLDLDLKTMPVFLVLAGKKKATNQKPVVATEYVNIAKNYLEKNFEDHSIIKTYGSTECFVPEFADLIVDHTQTGETLRKNALFIFDILCKSTTYFISSKHLSKTQVKELNTLLSQLKRGLAKMDLDYPEFFDEKSLLEVKV